MVIKSIERAINCPICNEKVGTLLRGCEHYIGSGYQIGKETINHYFNDEELELDYETD